jgi:hypothetical protein
MSEKLMFLNSPTLMAILLTTLSSNPASAQEAELQLTLASGLSKREVTISDVNGTPLNSAQCVYQSQAIAVRWVRDNLGGAWMIQRLYCGPPKRNI